MNVAYNENDAYPAQWMRNLIAAGHLPAGTVLDDDIRKLTPHDLEDFSHAHFFAGIGLWALVLDLAGWPYGSTWTGSCPCQPFSGAGRREGFADERHLWPDWFRLIAAERPECIFGEQVASPDGYAWLDLVQADLESASYAFGAVISPAAGYGAPHGRHRIYWMAYTADAGRQRRRAGETRLNGAAWFEPERFRDAGGMGEPTSSGRERKRHQPAHGIAVQTSPNAGGMGDTERIRTRRHAGAGVKAQGETSLWPICDVAGPPSAAYWTDLEWLPCSDGKLRPTQPGLFPLAHGHTGRVGKLRAYGNAIVVPQAVEFIKAAMQYFDSNETSSK